MMEKHDSKIAEMLENFAMSSEMEGLQVTDTMRDMCLSVLDGAATLEECLSQIGAKYAQR